MTSHMRGIKYVDTEEWSTRLRQLLANLYLNQCVLPDCAVVVGMLSALSPRKYVDGA